MVEVKAMKTIIKSISSTESKLNSIYSAQNLNSSNSIVIISKDFKNYDRFLVQKKFPHLNIYFNCYTIINALNSQHKKRKFVGNRFHILHLNLIKI